MSDDVQHMRAALALARRGLGSTWPNPSVGCVLVKDGRVIARATTAPGGRPHAERQALEAAGAQARGATAYVTLEPCAHHGGTPPCADALIAARVVRVVVGCLDPYPAVNGQGMARLREAGVPVDLLLEAEARELHHGFLTRVRAGRPAVTLKLASTLDGRIATASGESQWITGPAARRAAHALRARHDATMVGVGTVVADNPELTCRIKDMRQTPDLRIVADTNLRTPLMSRLVASARETPTWIMHCASADPARRAGLEAAGVRMIEVARGEPGIDPAAALQRLGQAGLTSVLVEGGAQLAAALLRAGLVDRLAWFHAPTVMGGDGLPAAAAFGVRALEAMPRFRPIAQQALGEDLMTLYEKG